MKKVIITVTAAGLIAAMSLIFISHSAGWALNNRSETKTYAKTYTVEKNGVTKTVEALQELPPGADAEQPPPYDPSDREWAGDPQTWAQLKQIVREAFQDRRDATLVVNRGRSAESKGNLAHYYSAKSIALQQAQQEIDATFSAPGEGWTERAITKMDFKGISVKDDKATVVVDIGEHVADSRNSFDNAEQHTVTLELENDQWLITKDLWVFMPGYGP